MQLCRWLAIHRISSLVAKSPCAILIARAASTAAVSAPAVCVIAPPAVFSWIVPAAPPVPPVPTAVVMTTYDTTVPPARQQFMADAIPGAVVVQQNGIAYQITGTVDLSDIVEPTKLPSWITMSTLSDSNPNIPASTDGKPAIAAGMLAITSTPRP